MRQTKKYPTTDFYVGELYLYTKFGNLLADDTIEETAAKVKRFSLLGAINFQRDMISRYIDWENMREYTGFLTIFYKKGDKYICLHDGFSYQLDGPNFIDNLVSLDELMPKIDNKDLSKISINQALQFFDILFKLGTEVSTLYIGEKQQTSDFYVGDITLRERTPIEHTDSRIQYINLPHHIMLEKDKLEMYSFGKANYVNTVYRCLFLKDGVDLYNIHNNQFYNPNEDSFDAIIPFTDYMRESKQSIDSETISIPKALKLLKRTM